MAGTQSSVSERLRLESRHGKVPAWNLRAMHNVVPMEAGDFLQDSSQTDLALGVGESCALVAYG